ncbi:hypothetical protein SteCoe_36749 [Stentor coeruleus]|uniref:Uncharacterized protein n=1 Tax=Stentor coeruleus TaxID=5963 RepID=A0A1R2APF6_9CILI|nr:hypothetical protein SteCoe_36749 [Stentor coeruleus]
MFLALIILSVSGVMFETFDEMLGPSKISWPSDWVENNIMLSSNHKGASATISIYCKTSVDVPTGSYVTIFIPDFVSETYYYTTLEDYSADDTMIFTTISITLPEAGAYGPISLVISQSDGGQILASNEIFGSFAVIEQIPTSGTVTVTYAASTSYEVSQSTSLTFALTMDVQMETFDYLSIDLSASEFTYGDNGDLSFSKGGDNFNDTSAIYDEDNDCIWIFPLINQISESTQIEFTLSGFYNPPAVGLSSQWTVTAHRYGTPTTLKSFSGTGPSTATTPGAITFTSWEPYNNNIAKTEIVSNLALYMTLKFTIKHELVDSDYIKVTFTNADLFATTKPGDDKLAKTTGSIDDYYILTDNDELTCTAISAAIVKCVVNLNADEVLASGSTVTIYNLVTFSSSSASISSIISYTSADKKIDESASTIGTITYTGTLIAEPSLYIADQALTTTAIAAEAGNTGIYGIVLSLLPGTTVDTTTSMTLYFPFVKEATANNENFAIGTSGFALYGTQKAALDATTFDSATAASSTFNTGYITFSPGETLTASQQFNIFFVGGTSPTAGAIFFPSFITTAYSRIEAAIKYTVSSKTYVFSKPLWFYDGEGVVPTLQLFCTDALFKGLPAFITFKVPFEYAGAGYTFMMDFELSIIEDLGSGLESGSVYPADSDDGTLKIVYEASGNGHLQYTFSAALDKTNTYKFAFPVGAPPNALTATVIATLYAVDSDGDKWALASSASVSATPTVASGSQLILVATDTFTGKAFETDYTLTVEKVPSADGDYDIAIVLPDDYSFTSSASATLAAASMPNFFVFKSDSSLYNFVSAYSPTNAMAAAGAEIIITSITTAWYSGTQTAYIALGPAGAHGGAVCNGAASNDITVDAEDITDVSIDLTSSSSYGLDVTTADFTITAVLPGPVYAGATVTVVWDTDGWTFTSATCTMTLGDNDSTSCSSLIIDADVESGSLIISVSGAILPTVTVAEVTASTNVFAAISTITIAKSANNIYTYTEAVSVADAKTKTEFSAGVTAVKTSGVSELEVFPDVIGSILVYFRIVFSTFYDIPSGSEISISGETFATDAVAEKNTWCNYGFSDAKIESGVLKITTNTFIEAGSDIEIRKDLAFDIPTDGLTSPSFLVAATRPDNDKVIDDTGVTTQTITYQDSTSLDLSSVHVIIGITNQGFVSAHTFTFVTSVAIKNDTIIFFDASEQYNPIPGPSFKFKECPGYLFLNAESDNGEIICFADHWVITCSGITADADATVTIYIDIANPSEASADWGIYIYNSDGTPTVDPAYLTITDGYTSIPKNNIDVYFVVHDESDQDFSSDLKFLAYIDEDFQDNSCAFVLFPKPYILAVDNPGTVSCGMYYDDGSDSGVTVSEGECSVSENWIEFPIATATTVASDGWSVLVTAGIYDPLEGFASGDDDLVFSIYDFWTGRFTILTVADTITEETTSVAFTSSSYSNLNAAFTGYDESSYAFLTVNGGNDIYLVQGTYSSWIKIEAEGDEFLASSVILQASNLIEDGPLEFSDGGSYILSDSLPFNYFKVGASRNEISDQYYISWEKVEEVAYDGKSVFYRAPTKTVVQVFDSKTYSIEIGTIYTVPVGIYSIPINLSLGSVSPFTGISVEISLSDNTDTNSTITFMPETLEFSAGISENAFDIVCDDCEDGESFDISFVISGDDAAAFEISDSASFTIGALTDLAPEASFSFGDVGRTSIPININTNSMGIVTWALMGDIMYYYGDNSTNLTFIEDCALLLVGDTEGLSVKEQEYAFHDTLVAIDDSDWEAFSLSVVLESSLVFIAGQNFVDQSTNAELYVFNYLVTDSDYAVVGYFDNFSGNDPYYVVGYFDNFSGNDPYYFEDFVSTLEAGYSAAIKVTFADGTTAPNDAVIRGLAKGLKTNKSRFSVEGSRSRSLAVESTVDLQPSVLDSQSSVDLVNSVPESDLLSALTAEGLSPLSITASEIESSGTPGFDFKLWEEDTDYIQVNVTATVDGQICCLCEFDADETLTLTSDLIYLGLDRTGANASERTECRVVDAGDYEFFYANATEIVDGAFNWTTFTLTCTDCNNYPILPECMADGLINYTYTGSSSSNAYSLAIALCALLAYLA